MTEADETRRQIETLLREMHQLRAEVGHLRALVVSTGAVDRRTMGTAEDAEHTDPSITPANITQTPVQPEGRATSARLTRRGLLRSIGAGAVGVMGAAMVDSLLEGTVTQAANGSPLTLGSNSTNLATLPTALGVTQASGQYVYGFGVVDGTVGHFAESATDCRLLFGNLQERDPRGRLSVGRNWRDGRLPDRHWGVGPFRRH